jgi:hypothetical protein
VSHKIISWWKYNPLLQKPASLDPVLPWAWYWYYGPDPASGCSYGQYHDEDYDFDMITAKDKVVYSPATGKPMQFVDMVPKEEFDEKLSKVTGKSFINSEVSCTSCNANLVSDYDLSELDKVHCVKCGKECNISTMEKNNIEGAKTMTVSAREQRVQNLKRRIRANILKKRKAEAANEKRVEEEELKKKRTLALKQNRKIKAEEEAKKEDEDDELISLDTIMEAMEEETSEEDLSEEALMDEKEECEEGEVCAADEFEDEELAEEPEVEESEVDEVEVEEPSMDDDMDFSTEESPELELDVEDDMGDEELDLDVSVEEPKKEGEDDYYDLDMVLSMVNKKIAAGKKAKAKVKAKKKVKAEEACDLEKDKEKETEVSLLDEKEEVEEKVEDVAEEVAPKEEMEAMKFEPLATTQAFANLRKEDIDMTLYHEDSDNPTWNVTVAGVPTAKIELRKQAAADEIRAVFCSEDYAKDLMVHCEKTGFIQTMNKVNAEFWSNYTSNKKIANRFKQEAKASFECERKKLLASYRQEYRNCINIVSAGMSKNFYPDMGNALKENLFTNLRTVGLPEQTAISVVEKSFAEGSAQYFDALFEKAEEYMNLTPDARKEIAAAISHGASLEHTQSLNEVAPATLGERVAQASVLASANVSSPMRVSNDVVLDSNAYKAQLRSVWRSR